MKKTLRLAFILCSLFLQAQLFANTVIVKGYVKDSANNVVANKTVKIYSTDSTNNGCLISHTVVTNANGYYIDTLTCNGDIRKLSIIVENCNGAKITNTPAAATNNIVESNFIICVSQISTPVSCKAYFSFTTNATAVKFSATGSATVSGDSIISRTWTFGDSTAPLTGNTNDPSHVYTKPGVYNVCMTIKTKKGCESSYCQPVSFTPAPTPVTTNCKAQFTFTAQGTTVKFTSAASLAPTGDSIISRTWTFGDTSAALTGNRVDPSHIYTKAGNYTACLSIKTKSGCESKICADFVIHDTTVVAPVPTNCKALFTYSIKDSVITFNSAASTGTSADDSIISRTWYYSDSANAVSLGGNVVAPSYKYSKPGSYNVYLVIKTKKGCESKVSVTVVIPAPVVPANCKASFTYTIKDSVVTFNSAASTATSSEDSIISRTWYYGDSSTSISLSGNVVAPSHKYSKPGSYNAYLVIKTKKGCESRVSVTVVIPAPVVPTNCKALFTYTIKDSVITFNSAASTATSSEDSIISRTWYYSDNSTSVSLGGNVVAPSYKYSKPGSYNVYMVIKTAKGCESKYSLIVVIPPVTVPCKATFSFTVQNGTVRFTSAASKASSSEDSIISRVWIFGDSSNISTVQGNEVAPTHNYAKSGKYTVTLYIKTKNGCESKYTETVTITTIDCPVSVQFTATSLSLKKIQFNSSLSSASVGDSIIQRNWKFGDNQLLSGNEVSPAHEFPLLGAYNTCLQVRTLIGCEATVCKSIVIQDTANTTRPQVDNVKIISINPNPVVTRMMANIYSSKNNVEVELGIYDIYGTKRMTVKKLLTQGNNIIEVATDFLPHGPYFLRATTNNGSDSKTFYKL